MYSEVVICTGPALKTVCVLTCGDCERYLAPPTCMLPGPIWDFQCTSICRLVRQMHAPNCLETNTVLRTYVHQWVLQMFRDNNHGIHSRTVTHFDTKITQCLQYFHSDAGTAFHMPWTSCFPAIMRMIAAIASCHVQCIYVGMPACGG